MGPCPEAEDVEAEVEGGAGASIMEEATAKEVNTHLLTVHTH